MELGSGLSFVLGAAGGAVISIATEAITGRAWGIGARQWYKRRSRQQLARLGRSDDLIRFGDEAVYIHQFVPGGWAPDNIQIAWRGGTTISESLDRADADLLPRPAHEIAHAVKVERSRLDNPQVDRWNGPTVAVENVTTRVRSGTDELPVLRVVASESDHAAAIVCSHLWQEWFDASDGDIVFDQRVRDGISGLLHSVGLNATIVTDDEQLVLTRRNPRMSSNRSGWHISVNEGMLPSDRWGEEPPDPRVGLVRGVKEELGIEIEAKHVKFHSAIFDMRRYQFALLGHVDLRGTAVRSADVVRERKLGLPRDKVENTSIELVDWNPSTVKAVLGRNDWIAHGWVNLALTAVSEFPRHANQFLGLLNKPVNG